MLEMTEASVVPNVTAQTEASGGVMPNACARDVAVAAVVCFTGGAGLALLLVLVRYQVSRRKKRKGSEGQKEEEEEGRSERRGVGETRRNVFPQWDRESMMLDTRAGSQSGQFQSRAAEDNGHFRCPDCSHVGQGGLRPNLMTWSNRINTEMEDDEEAEKRTMGMVTEGQRRKPGIQQGMWSRDVLNRANVSSRPRSETFGGRPETLAVHEAGRDVDSYRMDVEGKSMGHEPLHCQSCHGTYGAPQQATRAGRCESIMRDPAARNGLPPQHRWSDKSRNRSQFDIMKNTGLRRESRNVTFDMESLRLLEQGNRRGKDESDEDVATSRGRERERRAKTQCSRLLKVKLNLNPLRKSKVHPRKKNEQDEKEKGGSKKSDGKKRQRGKGGPEKGRKGKSGTKVTGGPDKSRRASDHGASVKEEEGKQKKTVSENEQTVQEQNECPENPQPGDPAGAEEQRSPADAPGQPRASQGGSVQYQGPASASGSPFSPSAAPRSHATSLALLGSAGPQPTGSRLSLQGGGFLLNNMAPGFKALLTRGPANSAAPGVTIGGPTLAASGAVDSFSRQVGGGVTPPANSLLANTAHANASHANSTQPAPAHNSPAGGPALSLAASSAVTPEPIQSLLRTQLPPDSPSLLARLNSDPAHALGLQTGTVLPQLAPESQAPPVKESLPARDGSPVAASPALGSGSTAETEAGPAPEGLTPAGSAVLAEGAAAGVSGDSLQAAEGPASGVGGHAADTAVLLHREYLSEEGDSSPRRKLRLALPEKTSGRPLTALERKIR